MDKPTWRARAQYWFDAWMSRGTIAIMALLGAATVAFVLVVAGVAVLLGVFPEDQDRADFWDLAWGNLMRTLDPGTMGGDTGWGFRILMLVVTVGGLIIVASLIGIVSGAFDGKMAELRKGRSRVLERDHTLILGWNSKLLPIVAELCTANESQRRGVIVILADRDKVEMEDDIRRHVPRPGRTAIVCRTGDPMSVLDVRTASPRTARSVIILPSDEDADPDAAVIKIALALTHDVAGALPGPRIVAELRDARNLEAARLLGEGRAQWILAEDLVTRMTVQTARQRGLSTVYTELLDFAGDEIYFTHQPQFAGIAYRDAQLRLDGAVVLGLERDGAVRLNPPADEVLQPDDRMIVLARDDDAFRPTAGPATDPEVVPARIEDAAVPEHTLILGRNRSLQLILDELGEYVAAGSTVWIGADADELGLRVPPTLAVTVERMDTTSRADLDGLDIPRFDHVIVLAYRDDLSPQAADARTLVTLLHIRDITDRAGRSVNVVTEMLDDRNRELAEVTKADDFIISDRLISLMLSQISENDRLGAVFAELFSSAGTEIYLRPASLYAPVGERADFAAVIRAASRRGETAIGYRIGDDAWTRSAGYGVHVNPPLTTARTFAPGDEVIVLAEHSLARIPTPSP